MPAADPVEIRLADHKARPGNSRARADHGTRIVQIPAVAQKPETHRRRNEVSGIILGIPVAGRSDVARFEHVVHGVDEAGIDDVVRIENDEAVECVLVIPFDLREQIFERKALADLLRIPAFVNNRSRFFCDFRRAVRAVVRADEDLNHAVRVLLRKKAVDAVCNDAFFVSAADQDREPVLFVGFRDFPLSEPRDRNKNVLIKITRREEKHDHKREDVNSLQNDGYFCRRLDRLLGRPQDSTYHLCCCHKNVSPSKQVIRNRNRNGPLSLKSLFAA